MKYKENEKEFIVTLFNGSSIFRIILQRRRWRRDPDEMEN